MSKHGAIKLSTLIITALLLAAALSASEAARPEGTLTVAVATFGNERWLPHLYVGAEDIVLKPLWENLVSRDPKTGELIPMLAERWQVTDGGRTWKFQLRKGVHFHDGRELTAEDVKFTFSSIAREGSANSLSTEFRLIKSMEIESRYAITIHFDKPSVVFANKVNQGLFASVAFIQSKSSIESAGEDGAERRPIGTGPWKFVEHVRGDRIVYEAVEGHWRATPNFKRLVMLKVPEPATRMAMLRAGSVDVIEIGGEYVDELKKVGVRTLTMPNVAWVYVILGGQWPTKPSYDRAVPWAQPDLERARKVRLALNLAVDKNAVMQRVMGNLGSVTGSWLAYPNDPWTTDALKNPYPYDPARAKALLSEAGYPKGFDVTMNLTAWPGAAICRTSEKRSRRTGRKSGSGSSGGRWTGRSSRRTSGPAPIQESRWPTRRRWSARSSGTTSFASATARRPYSSSSSTPSSTTSWTGSPPSRATTSASRSCATRWGRGCTTTCPRSPSAPPTTSPRWGPRSATGR